MEHEISSEPKAYIITQPSLKTPSGVISPLPLATLKHSIAKDRSRINIKPLLRYGEADLVTCALDVTKDIDSNEKPFTCSKAISCGNSRR